MLGGSLCGISTPKILYSSFFIHESVPEKIVLYIHGWFGFRKEKEESRNQT